MMEKLKAILTNILPILFILIFLPVSSSYAGTKIIDYGFEDWTGEKSSGASPAPGYIFSTSYDSYWEEHKANTEIIRNCSGRTAYEGTYYWHTQFYTEATDSCLGTMPSSINTRSNVGLSGEYPSGTKDTTSLTSVSSNILTIRVRFRATGDWSSANGSLDGGGGHKFMRVYGGDGSGDDSSALLKLTVDGNDSTPRMVTYLISEGNDWHEVGVNWQDGEWHSIVYMVIRNNNTNSANNVTLKVWVDDHDMSDSPQINITGTATDFGSQYRYMAFASNWSAQSAKTDIGYDIDKFEVWDGIPDSELPQATWEAEAQTGDTTWSDSTAIWCARVLVHGSSITSYGDKVILGFQGRNSGNYAIRKVSIAKKDPNAGVGDVIDSTWTKVTFDGNNVANWGTSQAAVLAGTEKLSDPVSFSINPDDDYYVTFMMINATNYLIASSSYNELYFNNIDHTDDVDWSNSGYSTDSARLHALSSIYATSRAPAAPVVVGASIK